MNQGSVGLDDFKGTARLFPLPDLVFFPNVLQPLHIFESRYRHMTADALAGDRLVALVLLKEGWDEDYLGKPAIHTVATLGRILAEQKTEDGRYNLLLRGLSRIRIIRETANDRAFREAEVELLHDRRAPDLEAERALLKEFAKQIPGWFPDQGQLADQFRQVLEKGLALGRVCDIFTFALPLEGLFKQTLLEQLDVLERARALLDRMNPTFPPKFSSN